MNKFKNSFLIVVCLMININIEAQDVFVNKGQDIIFNTGVQFIVKDGSFLNDMGNITNEGSVYIEGDVTNNANLNGGNSNSEFIIQNDWENNAVFLSDLSTVYLNGFNQTIRGTEESTFNNLVLENGSVKSLQVNSNILGVLNLNDSEMATTNYKMTILNNDVNAIEFNEEVGFVSSDINGRLVRNTNQTNSYIFPIGERNSILKYRPISILPSTNTSNQFEARFVNQSADIDGYFFSEKENDIKKVNEDFYHLVNQSIGTDEAQLGIFFKPLEDGEWQGIAQWDRKWKNLGKTSINNNYDLVELSYKSWKSNQDEPHLLINTENCKLAVPTGFSPNFSNTNDYFKPIKNCEIDSYSMSIYNRWGELIFISTDIDNAWDGTYKDEKASIGVYSWIIEYQLKDNSELISAKGTITLIQ